MMTKSHRLTIEFLHSFLMAFQLPHDIWDHVAKLFKYGDGVTTRNAIKSLMWTCTGHLTAVVVPMVCANVSLAQCLVLMTCLTRV